MNLLILTGMSGAGKTQAINALEDIGFYCVDNVPPWLISKFADLPDQSGGKILDIALVVDVRSRELFSDYIACLRDLESLEKKFKTIFLDCSDEVIMRRYKETRRRHPLLSKEITSIGTAISIERDLLESAKTRADFIIDTSHLTPTLMKNAVKEMFSQGSDSSMVISVFSFGFKHGPPTEADLVFDMRCLPNPFYIEELKEKTGLDAAVREYVLGSTQAKGMIPKLFDLVDYLVPLYIQEGKSRLVIGIGCTGGKHRSVTFAELLGEHLAPKGSQTYIMHRDLPARSDGRI